MVQKYEKRLKDGNISINLELSHENNEVMNGIYRKSIKQRIERFFEKVHECILIFTGWLG